MKYDAKKDDALVEIKVKKPKDDGRMTLVTAKQTDLEEIYLSFGNGGDKEFAMGNDDDLPLHFCYGPKASMDKACKEQDFFDINIDQTMIFNKQVKFGQPPIFQQINPGGFSNSPKMMEMAELHSKLQAGVLPVGEETIDMLEARVQAVVASKGDVHHMFGGRKLPEPGMEITGANKARLRIDSYQQHPLNLYLQLVNARNPQSWKIAMANGSPNLLIGYGPNNSVNHRMEIIVQPSGAVHIFSAVTFKAGAA